MFSTKMTILITALVVAGGIAVSVLRIEPVVQLINASDAFNVLRGGALVVLFSLLVTKPPRSIYMRLFLGLAGAALHIGSVYALLNFMMPLFDAFIFMAVAVVFAVEALEPETAPVHESFSRQTA